MTPHLYVPSSGSISPAKILSNVVLAISLSPIKIALSLGFIVNETLSNTFSPSIVLDRFSTVNKSFPISRSGVNLTYGYLLEDG